jgi:hypothetical protein
MDEYVFRTEEKCMGRKSATKRDTVKITGDIISPVLDGKDWEVLKD